MPYRVENIVRKGEVSCYKQFLLFSQCFPHRYLFNKSKCGIMCGNELTLYHTTPTFNDPEKVAFWKHCGKRRNCSWRAISPFPSVFYLFGELPAIFIRFRIVVCKTFEFGRVLQYKSFENTVGKRKHWSLRAITPIPTVFSTLLENFLPC